MGLRLLLRGDVARLADAAKRSLRDGGLLEIRSDDAAAVDALPARPHLVVRPSCKTIPPHQLVAFLCRLQAGLLVGCLFPRFPSHSPHSNLSLGA